MLTPILEASGSLFLFFDLVGDVGSGFRCRRDRGCLSWLIRLPGLSLLVRLPRFSRLVRLTLISRGGCHRLLPFPLSGALEHQSAHNYSHLSPSLHASAQYCTHLDSITLLIAPLYLSAPQFVPCVSIDVAMFSPVQKQSLSVIH